MLAVRVLHSLVRSISVLFLLPILAEVDSSGNSTRATSREKPIFYLLTLIPYAHPHPFLNPSWNGGDNIQPVLDLAVDLVNQRDDILADASLQLIHQADGCNERLTSLTIADFVMEAYNARGMLAGLIGPSCSSSTAALASVAGRPEIDVVSTHFAGSPRFENRSRYPQFLGMLGSTKSFVEGFLHLIRQGNWTRIAVLYDDSRQYYISTTQLLVQMSAEFPNIDIDFLSPVYSTKLPLENIQHENLRVIFVLTPIPLARLLLCRAYYLGLSFNKYQYVFMSATLSNFKQPVSFHYGGKLHKCSSEDLTRTVLNGSFLLYYNLLPNLDKPLLANITYSDFLDAYAKYRENYTLSTGRQSTESYFATLVFDAVWSWALVLDGVMNSLEDFEVQYGDQKTSNRIVQEFYQLNFEGMSGTISYDNQSGFIKREVVITQIEEARANFVAYIGPDGIVKCNQTTVCGTQAFFINDSFGVSVDRESRELAIFFFLVTAVQLFLVVVLHLATLKNLGTSSVKASSIGLLNLSYIGTYILILGALLWTLFSALSVSIRLRHYFCQLLWAWTFPIGFSLSFCPVLMKTWRLYRIFEHYLNPGPFISTPILITGTILITMLYLIVAIVWTASDSFVLKSRDYFVGSESAHLTLAVEFYCSCHFQTLWIMMLGLITLLLLSMGFLLALITRRIRNPSFTTSSLRMLVFLMAIVIILGGSMYAVSEVVRRQDRKSYFSFSTLCTVINTIIGLFIACVFLPPLLPLIKITRVVFNKPKFSHQASFSTIVSRH